MDLRLQGKRALVAGASRGLGYALAQGLAREGADLVINSRDPEGINAAAQKLAGETKVQVTPLPGDVANPAIPDKLIEGLVGVERTHDVA